MKMLCRFCEKEFEFEGDGRTLADESMNHLKESHPEKAKELQNRMFNMVKDYYIIEG